MRSRIYFCCLFALAELAACAQTPMGPTVMVLPGPRKPFDAFQADQVACKTYSETQVAGQAEAANKRAVGAAVIGTVLGAGLGAAVGGGNGAAIGAAAGANGGVASGAVSSSAEQGSIQAQYDNAFGTCMWSKGNRVAGLPDPEVAAYETAPAARRPVRQAVRHAPTSSGPSSSASKVDAWVEPKATGSATVTPASSSAPSGWVQPTAQ